MKALIFAANWKMNHGPTTARAFICDFVQRYAPRADRQVIFFPPALSFDAARTAVASATPDHVARPDIAFGTQNIYWEDKGAFTGEISAPIARDAGATYTLVGHSERRHVFGETNSECAQKCAAAERANVAPILCVGETLEQRERGETETIVIEQLKSGLGSLTRLAQDPLIIAYEPVWAIGTGKNATPDDAAQIHTVLRGTLTELIGDKAESASILYGGSVKADNARQLLDAKNVDGLLVGGASLDVDSWLSICLS